MIEGSGLLGVSGNLRVQTRLSRYLDQERRHPAIIFSGARSEAKLKIVKNGAKRLFCLSSSRPFCGKCSPCDRIEREMHPDVWVWRESEEETIKVELVREICHRMALSPIEGKFRIFILEDCHRLTTAAANAFLKTLEEPGLRHYFWLLTSQPGTLPATLRSRCLEFSFQPELDAGVDRRSEFTALFKDFERHRDPYRVSRELKEKNDVLAFVRFQEERLRDLAVRDTSWDPILQFERWLELEGRLRSNANYGLLLETALAESV